MHGQTPEYTPLELWAGVECTLNRVENRYRDQLQANGHLDRADDLDLFAQLGFRALRISAAWERIAPDGLQSADWSWLDRQLTRLRELGIRPILGLMHHGSGPRLTPLDDPAFPAHFAAYAAAVARRYPWVEDYTPINEPLTTARFCGLSGHWYPHGTDERVFVRLLIHQCRATVWAMRAVRQINPSARLIQTEDLGKTHSTRPLAYQARFENERRWVSLELLAGQLRPGMRMARHLVRYGIQPRELREFLDQPCPPDVLGFNYYVTSERFLDHRCERYPPEVCGGNGKDTYADTEAVRSCRRGPDGLAALLTQAWQRFRIPLAMAEIHLGSHREAQLRWLLDAWKAAQALRQDGVDVRAVTLWSLLGSFDWNVLVTREQGYYESGVFDVRNGTPRPTALARLARELATGAPSHHPVLATPGWWTQGSRLVYGKPSAVLRAADAMSPAEPAGAPILIAGAGGTLGRAFARICRQRGLRVVAYGRGELDITESRSIARALERVQPWAVVNAAGYVRVDEAELDLFGCHRINVIGAARLARECSRRGIGHLTFSTDLVFDGRMQRPYLEEDEPAPLNVYGWSKVWAEQRVAQRHTGALLVRTSAFFGPWDTANFLACALAALKVGKRFLAAEDWIVSPTYVPDLVHACLDLLIDGESGVWHLANQGQVSWAEFARVAAGMSGLDQSLVHGRPGATLAHRAPRPVFSALRSARGLLLPTWEDGLRRFVETRPEVGAIAAAG